MFRAGRSNCLIGMAWPTFNRLSFVVLAKESTFETFFTVGCAPRTNQHPGRYHQGTKAQWCAPYVLQKAHSAEKNLTPATQFIT